MWYTRSQTPIEGSKDAKEKAKEKKEDEDVKAGKRGRNKKWVPFKIESDSTQEGDRPRRNQGHEVSGAGRGGRGGNRKGPPAHANQQGRPRGPRVSTGM